MAVFHASFFARTLGRTVPLTVILPTDKMNFGDTPRREEGKPFKTLYLLHGVFGSEIDWLYGTRIQRYAEERDLAVVMPAGENGFYLDQPWSTNNYGEFIGRELVDFTRRSFPLSHRREDTFIGGLSMGGFGAMRNGLKYNDVFGAIVSLSGALILDEEFLRPVEDPRIPIERREYRQHCFGPDLAAAIESDRNPLFLAKAMAEAGTEFPLIYMACGERDPLLEKNRRFYSELLKLGVEDLQFEIGPGAHEWDFWDRYILRALDWLPLGVSHSPPSAHSQLLTSDKHHVSLQ